jgi:hypothetical protein
VLETSKKEEEMSKPSLIGVMFPTEDVYGFKTLQPGDRTTILSISVPSGMVGFIEEVATNWPSEDMTTWQEWYIDNVRQGGQLYTPIGVILGTLPKGGLPSPRRFEPPIIMKDSVHFIGQNNGAVSLVFQAYCNGTFYEKP